VITGESDHPQVYKTKASAYERQLRKQVREIIGNPVMLAVMRMHQYREECDPDRSLAKPFKGTDPDYKTTDVLRTLCKDPGHLSQVGWQMFFDFGQKVFDVLVSQRLRVEQGRGTWGATFAYDALENPVTETQFMRSLENAIINHGMEYCRRDEVNIPKWSPAEAIPKSNRHLR
jgi:hypothetical protein